MPKIEWERTRKQCNRCSIGRIRKQARKRDVKSAILANKIFVRVSICSYVKMVLRIRYSMMSTKIRRIFKCSLTFLFFVRARDWLNFPPLSVP